MNSYAVAAGLFEWEHMEHQVQQSCQQGYYVAIFGSVIHVLQSWSVHF